MRINSPHENPIKISIIPFNHKLPSAIINFL